MYKQKNLKIRFPELLRPDIEKLILFNPNLNATIFYQFIELIFVKSKKETEFTNLKIVYLRKHIADDITKYINLLIKAKIINCDNHYIKGVKSFGYRVNKKYFKTPELGIEVLEPKTTQFKKIISEITANRTNVSRLSDEDKFRYKYFMSVELDYIKCYKIINNLHFEGKTLEEINRIKIIYAIHTENFRDKRKRYYKISKLNNRISTNLTNIPKVLLSSAIQKTKKEENLKEHYKIFGKENIDKILKTNSDSLDKFHDITKKGLFYEDLGQFLNISRDECKKITFPIIYSKNTSAVQDEKTKKWKRIIPYQNEKEMFSKRHPDVYKIIKLLKNNKSVFKKSNKKNINLPIYLQIIEADLNAKLISRFLYENNINSIAIHDSVIIDRKHEQLALELIKKAYVMLNYDIPTFKSNYFAN